MTIPSVTADFAIGTKMVDTLGRVFQVKGTFNDDAKPAAEKIWAAACAAVSAFAASFAGGESYVVTSSAFPGEKALTRMRPGGDTLRVNIAQQNFKVVQPAALSPGDVVDATYTDRNEKAVVISLTIKSTRTPKGRGPAKGMAAAAPRAPRALSAARAAAEACAGSGTEDDSQAVGHAAVAFAAPSPRTSKMVSGGPSARFSDDDDGVCEDGGDDRDDSESAAVSSDDGDGVGHGGGEAAAASRCVRSAGPPPPPPRVA